MTLIKDAKSKDLPFPREVLIDAARLKARGAEWEAVATATGAGVGDLVTFSIDHPEIWGPLYERAEKLRLAEAEGQTIKGLCTLLKGNDETAAENAARELLIHRRHVERRRSGGRSRRLPERGLAPPTGDESLAETTPGGRNPTICQGGQKPSFGNAAHNMPRWLTDDPPPEEIVRRITYAANRVAHGDDYHRIARETGQTEIDVTRWAFLYAKSWDRAYPTARRTAAQAGAALAINRLLIFVASPDLKQAARAARTLLVHRRHMHWARANQPPRHQEHQEHQEAKNCATLDAAEAARGTDALSREPSSNLVPLCLGGENSCSPWRLGGKKSCRTRDGPG